MDEALETHHASHITIVQTNHNESLLLMASSDHRISVFHLDQSGNRTPLDVFGAHDAEIREAKWFHYSVGTYFVTLGNDLQARIWTQDTTQAPMSGRRFKRVASVKCEGHTPFTSVDVKTVGRRTYLVLIDRQGLLSLYEPTKLDDFKDWSLIDRLQTVNPAPGKGEQTAFKVIFDQNVLPLPYINGLSDDEGQLTLAVTALDQVKIYRSTNDRKLIESHVPDDSPAQLIAQGATRRLCFFEVLHIQPQYLKPLTSAGLLVRDVAFRPMNVKGNDVVAIADINGSVSLYEIQVQRKGQSNTQRAQPMKESRSGIQSNLTSALHPTAASSQAAQQSLSRTNYPFPYTHHYCPLLILEDAHLDAWSVKFDDSGDILWTSGSEGGSKIWQRTEGSDHYELIGEQTVEDDTDSELDSLEEIESET